MDDIVLYTKNLKKVYNADSLNAVTALHDINIEVHKGDFLGVMGPSGSGKSTFINMISTMDYPTDGHVYIQGKSVMKMSANEIGRFRYENLGFIFQSFNLLDTHTIYENIALPLTLAKVDPKTIEDRVVTISKQLNIDNLLNKVPLECSGGQRQRTAIARALIKNPKLLLCDEPTGALDSKTSRDILVLLEKINAKYNTTMLIVTHNNSIKNMVNKVILLKDGMIKKDYENEVRTPAAELEDL